MRSVNKPACNQPAPDKGPMWPPSHSITDLHISILVLTQRIRIVRKSNETVNGWHAIQTYICIYIGIWKFMNVYVWRSGVEGTILLTFSISEDSRWWRWTGYLVVFPRRMTTSLLFSFEPTIITLIISKSHLSNQNQVIACKLLSAQSGSPSILLYNY